MGQAHPTGCLNSELRFERDKKPISEGREAPWGDTTPPPPPVTSQSILYTVPPAPSEYCTCGEGGGGVGNIEGLRGSQEA
jgi:hypothetical protein